MLKKVLLLSLSVVWLVSFSQAEPTMIPSAPSIAAKSYILMDANSGKVIAENNADLKLDPASLTKVMTAYVADYEIEQGNINLDDVVTISKNAWARNYQGSSLMFLEVGKKVSVNDLMKGVIISSGNDASVALAEHTAGNVNAFVDLMNQHAERLGMESSHFSNVHGLTAENHYSTARDMARLAQAAIQEFPDMYKLYAQRSFTYNGIKQYNRNRLLWRDPSVDGMKTGHTSEAGYCLIASAKRENMRLIAVLLGTKSEEARVREAQKLFSYGFRYFETIKVYDKGQVAKQLPIWGGATKKVGLVPQADVYLTLPKSQVDNVHAKVLVNKYVQAPVNKGDSLGELILSEGSEELMRVPLTTDADVEQGGFFYVLWSKIKLFFYKLIA